MDRSCPSRCFDTTARLPTQQGRGRVMTAYSPQGDECPNCKHLKKQIERLFELADDLRCYTHDWDWKHGAGWDREYKSIRQALQPQDKTNPQPATGTECQDGMPTRLAGDGSTLVMCEGINPPKDKCELCANDPGWVTLPPTYPPGRYKKTHGPCPNGCKPKGDEA
jgi:hypothetical protein